MKEELEEKITYWIINGATCSGKSTVAKHFQSEYGYKLIEFETYLPALKEKLANPDEGEEVPLKKILNHFQKELRDNSCCVYVLDGFPYDGKDLEAWIEVVGCPNIWNLDVEEK